jgi:hypothetical protein
MTKTQRHTFVFARATGAKLAEIVSASDEIERHARSRTIDLSVDELRRMCAAARRDGYSAAHGGGVPNSYRYRAESSAALVVRDRNRQLYYVTVGRGDAPNGAHGNVGPSVRPQLGADWGHDSGRHERLIAWSRRAAGLDRAATADERAPMHVAADLAAELGDEERAAFYRSAANGSLWCGIDTVDAARAYIDSHG